MDSLNESSDFNKSEAILTIYKITVVRRLIADGLSDEQIFNALKEI